jgi:Asp/Glu/hydantoin racemase
VVDAAPAQRHHAQELRVTATATRIALIHALAHSVAPVNEELARQWPQCAVMNLLDDSLSADLARDGGGLDERMHARFIALAGYAVETGAQGILFTCSAFGPCIESVQRRFGALPVLKPNEAMIAAALETGQRIGLLASFASTLASMPDEFPPSADLRLGLAEGALAALNAGDEQRHDELVAQAAERLASQGCGLIALAQFSLARAQHRVAERTGLPVLTTVASAVRELRRRVEK